jgi:hypothetical protein
MCIRPEDKQLGSVAFQILKRQVKRNTERSWRLETAGGYDRALYIFSDCSLTGWVAHSVHSY